MKPLPCQPIFLHELHEIPRFIFRKKPISAKSVDPWAGSYYVETLTHEIAHKAWELIEEVEELGWNGKSH